MQAQTRGSFWPWLPKAIDKAVVSVEVSVGYTCSLQGNAPGTPGNRFAENTVNDSVKA